MPRATKTITISLPPEVVGQINFLTKKEGRTRTEVLREALKEATFESNHFDIYGIIPNI